MQRKLSLLAPVAIMLAAFAPNASATLELTLQSGATTIVVTDGGAGDTNAAAGYITYIGAIGGWSMNVTTATVGQNPLIDLSSQDTRGTGSGTLILKFTSTGFTEPFNASFVSSVGGTLAATHSLSYSAYVDNSNALYGTGTQIGSTLAFSNPPPSFSGGTSGGAAAANSLFSLTQIVTITGGRVGTTSFDAAIDAVPEPATVALLGGVLLLTFGALRRKARHA